MQIFIGDDDADQKDVKGERRLYLAVLITAIEDVTSPNKLDRKNALTWFEEEKGEITFKDCVDVLELSSARLAKIYERIHTKHPEFKKMNFKKRSV